MLSIADCCPTSGFAPAPSPSVKFTPEFYGLNYFVMPENQYYKQKIHSFNSLFKHVVYSVTTASTTPITLITFDWFFGKSNEILPNSELLIILFGFDINY
jgi:hypothetical protein